MSQSLTLLIASETRYVRGTDGCARSTTGVDGYPFWQRYLDAAGRCFDRVLVLARTASSPRVEAGAPVEGPGVRLVPLPDYRGAWGHVRTRALLLQTMREAIARADALCLRAPGPIAGAAWRLWPGRAFGVEVVGDPLDALARGAVRTIGRPVARLVLARELRAMCRAASAVAYVTEEALQRRYPAGGWSIGCSDVELDDAAFADEAAIRVRLAAAGGRPRHLVFVGSLARLYKGQDVLIDALARVRARGLDLSLTMVGDGFYRATLEARARARGLADAVDFTGQLAAGAAVRGAVERADLFVLPSRTEGMPRAMLEAMARGVPCLGAAVGGIPELLPAERLVPPGDVDALAAALVRFGAPAHDLLPDALRDRGVAARYHGALLRPRRDAFLARLAAATRAERHRDLALAEGSA